MIIQFADNVHTKLVNVVNPLLTNAEEARIAVAFAKFSGFRLVESALDACLEKGGRVEFIVGLDFHTTDAQVLRALRTRATTMGNCSVYCYSDPTDNAAAYHPKLYLFLTGAQLTGIVGSSNLTQGGLKDNVEVNAILGFEEWVDEAEIFLDIYDQLKLQPTRFVPDDDYIDAYEDMTKRMAASREKSAEAAGICKALQALRLQEETLPRPFVDSDRLRGWKKLVYEKLPTGEFKTRDLYKHVSEFQQTYPTNQTTEAKTRQILQQLRDLGLIIHLGRGRWMQKPPD